MIRLLTEPILPKISSGSSFVGIKLTATLAAYQTKYSFFTVWIQWKNDLPTAWIAKLDETIFLVAEATAEFTELRNFFAAIGFESIQAEASVIRRLGYPVREVYSILRREQEGNLPASLSPPPNLRLVYDILFSEVNDALHQTPFDAWYVDLSHRIRHGTALVTLVEQAAVAVASHIVGDCAVISGVATLPDRRGRGLASAALEDAIRKCGVRNIFAAAKEETIPFYLNNRFAQVGELAIHYANEGIKSC